MPRDDPRWLRHVLFILFVGRLARHSSQRVERYRHAATAGTSLFYPASKEDSEQNLGMCSRRDTKWTNRGRFSQREEFCVSLCREMETGETCAAFLRAKRPTKPHLVCMRREPVQRVTIRYDTCKNTRTRALVGRSLVTVSTAVLVRIL